MKAKLVQLKAVAQRARSRAATLALAPLVALTCSPVFAALPTMPTPTSGIDGAAIGQGDWMGAMGGWFKTGFTILALIVVSYGFIRVMIGALGKWREYSTGRADIGDLKEYFIVGTILGVFMVVLATYALSVLGGTTP